MSPATTFAYIIPCRLLQASYFFYWKTAICRWYIRILTQIIGFPTVSMQQVRTFNQIIKRQRALTQMFERYPRLERRYCKTIMRQCKVLKKSSNIQPPCLNALPIESMEASRTKNIIELLLRLSLRCHKQDFLNNPSHILGVLHKAYHIARPSQMKYILST